MAILASLKFMLTLLIKRRPLLLVPMVLMLTGVCLLVYIIPLLLFKGVCLLSFMVFAKKLWRYSWTISPSMEPLLTIVSTTLIKFCRDVRRQIWCLTGRTATWGSARYLYLYLLGSSRVVSCLWKLSHKIGVCIEVYHSFLGELCIRECGVVYDGILMRSLLIPSLHSVFSSRNRPYDDSYEEY